MCVVVVFFFQAEDGIRDIGVTGVQTCALPISRGAAISSTTSRRWARTTRLTVQRAATGSAGSTPGGAASCDRGDGTRWEPAVRGGRPPARSGQGRRQSRLLVERRRRLRRERGPVGQIG